MTEDRPSGDKAVRAEPYTAQGQGGNVLVVRGPWMQALIDEQVCFPVGRTRDAAAVRFNLPTLRKQARRVFAPIKGLL